VEVIFSRDTFSVNHYFANNENTQPQISANLL